VLQAEAQHIRREIKQQIHGLFIWVRERVKWVRDLVSLRKVEQIGLHEGSKL